MGYPARYDPSPEPILCSSDHLTDVDGFTDFAGVASSSLHGAAGSGAGVLRTKGRSPAECNTVLSKQALTGPVGGQGNSARQRVVCFPHSSQGPTRRVIHERPSGVWGCPSLVSKMPTANPQQGLIRCGFRTPAPFSCWGMAQFPWHTGNFELCPPLSPIYFHFGLAPPPTPRRSWSSAHHAILPMVSSPGPRPTHQTKAPAA